MVETAGSSVTVPHTALAPEVLRAVVESFVLREGTDYGERELTLEEKVARVIELLERGEVTILYHPESATVDIVARPGRDRGGGPAAPA